MIAGLVLLGTEAGVLRAVAGARQRVLAVKVDRFALDIVLGAAGRAELPEFEDPAFHDRLQRAVFASRAHPAMVVTALAAGFQAILTVVAVTAVFAVLVRWLLPFALLAVLPTLKAARDEAKEIRALGLAGTLRRRWTSRYGQEIAARLAGDPTTGAVIGAMWWLVATGRIELATALTALAGLWQLSLRAQMIGALLNGLGESVLYMKDLRGFAAEAGSEHGQPVLSPGEFVSVRAESVAFRYPGSLVRALEDVSIEVRAGEVVALVGANGSGKTTLAKILAGLYRPDSGLLLYGDGDAGAEPERLRAVSAVVFQDFVRYKLTAADNIAFGRPETPPDKARAVLAAEQAGAHEFLDRLDQGYDTVQGLHRRRRSFARSVAAPRPGPGLLPGLAARHPRQSPAPCSGQRPSRELSRRRPRGPCGSPRRCDCVDLRRATPCRRGEAGTAASRRRRSQGPLEGGRREMASGAGPGESSRTPRRLVARARPAASRSS